MSTTNLEGYARHAGAPGGQVRYVRFHDPGHSWLRVSRAEITRLGLDNAISPYSYVSELSVYLEEDQDLGLWVLAKRAIGESYEIHDTHTDEDSAVRNLDRFTPAADWREQYANRIKLLEVATGQLNYTRSK